jgi:hypothetical protein
MGMLNNIELQGLSVNINTNSSEDFDFLSEIEDGLTHLVNTIQQIEKVLADD